MDFFFYGALRNAMVRTAVLGGKRSRSRVSPAWVEGFRLAALGGPARGYGGLVPGRGRVAGVFVRGLDGRDARRLDRFEGGGYRRTRLMAILEDGNRRPAYVFLPRRWVAVGQRIDGRA
jgi:gamma-glutamylcyclotransferase (GGCT)/AIG2-like uncharacterized protein YtfP